MNVLNIIFFLSSLNFSISLSLPTCMTCSPFKLHVILDPHLSSLLLAIDAVTLKKLEDWKTDSEAQFQNVRL